MTIIDRRTEASREDALHRLCWRWKDSGIEGRGAWMRDLSTVQAWKDSLDHRYHEVMEHWIESSAISDLAKTPALGVF